jgi:hypothetical protein
LKFEISKFESLELIPPMRARHTHDGKVVGGNNRRYLRA